jgi:hypothetical protein
MERVFLLFILIAAVLFACKKESNTAVQPVAKFSVGRIGEDYLSYGGYGDSSFFAMGTKDTYNLINQSTNTDSILWDFGNGIKSNSTNPLFPSERVGTYKVTLTAFKNGRRSTASKQIAVHDRVVKSFSINDLQLNKFLRGQNRFPTFSKVNLWMEIKYSQGPDAVTPNGDVLAPTIYKSPIFENVDSSFHSSLAYTLLERVIIYFPVNNQNYPLTGRGTFVNLYAQDNSGSYLLTSSTWFTDGLQFFGSGPNPFVSKNFIVGVQEPFSTNRILLNCAYE